jgi:hypothetical protein
MDLCGFCVVDWRWSWILCGGGVFVGLSGFVVGGRLPTWGVVVGFGLSVWGVGYQRGVVGGV